MDNLDYELLINAIEKRPVLWDKKEYDFKDRDKTRAAWEDIFQLFIKNFSNLPKSEKRMKGKALMSKWTNMRDSWVKCHKRLNEQMPGTKKKREYLFFNQMMFLTKTVRHKNEDIDVDVTDTDCNIFTAKKDNSIKHSEEFKEISASSGIKIFSKQGSSKKRRYSRTHYASNFDEDRSFFESILPSVQKFDEDQKLEFRLQTLQIIKKIKSEQTNSREVFFIDSCQSTDEGQKSLIHNADVHTRKQVETLTITTQPAASTLSSSQVLYSELFLDDTKLEIDSPLSSEGRMSESSRDDF